jgi:pimeloyl-ACP methyl ester carboxylesterase
LKPGLPPEIANNQNNVGKHWEDNPTWSKYQPYVNSLKIAGKIPGAWLVQIKDAGHAVMDQYPEEIGNILNTFLSTTAQSN